MFRRHAMRLAAAALVGLTPSIGTAQTKPRELVIFAGASLKRTLDEATAAWVKKTGKPAPKISYGPSDGLAKRIRQGARADVFLSADLAWMDYLADKNLIKRSTRVDLLVNQIALIAPSDSTATVTLAPGVDLTAAIGQGRLAMPNVNAVQAGKYGKAALEKLGVWEKVKDKIAQTDNVRAALLLVSGGEAPLGIVATTDAAADPNVKVLAKFPEDTHPPIVHPIAVLKTSGNRDAQEFTIYLRSAEAVLAFEKQGFMVQ